MRGMPLTWKEPFRKVRVYRRRSDQSIDGEDGINTDRTGRSKTKLRSAILNHTRRAFLATNLDN
jgi:hypothetical protein